MNDDPDQTPREPQAADAVAVAVPMLPPVPAGPRNIWRKWLRVTTRPSVASFARELPTANWYDIFTSLLVLDFWSAVIDVVFHRSDRQILPVPHWDGTVAGVTIPNWLASMGYMVYLPFSFLVIVGVFYIIARGLGGKGNFLDQAYAMALYEVPVASVITVISLVPVVGLLVSEIFSLYEFVLMALAIAASHRITVGRSVLVLVSRSYFS